MKSLSVSPGAHVKRHSFTHLLRINNTPGRVREFKGYKDELDQVRSSGFTGKTDLQTDNNNAMS